MKTRIDYSKVAPGVYQAMDALDRYLAECVLDERLLHLVRLRASQINGCAYCIDMHWKDLRVLGEPEQRLYGLEAWREAPYYSDRERVALAWAEAITLVEREGLPDALFEEAAGYFSPRELADLALAIAAINAWNRLCITARLEPGGYQPAASAAPQRASA